MPKPQTELDWQRLDTSTLKGADLKAFQAYAEANDAMKLQKEIMEEQFTKTLSKQAGNNEKPVYNYKWGFINYAFAPEKNKKNTSTGGVSLYG